MERQGTPRSLWQTRQEPSVKVFTRQEPFFAQLIQTGHQFFKVARKQSHFFFFLILLWIWSFESISQPAADRTGTLCHPKVEQVHNSPQTNFLAASGLETPGKSSPSSSYCPAHIWNFIHDTITITTSCSVAAGGGGRPHRSDHWQPALIFIDVAGRFCSVQCWCKMNHPQISTLGCRESMMLPVCYGLFRFSLQGVEL